MQTSNGSELMEEMKMSLQVPSNRQAMEDLFLQVALNHLVMASEMAGF